MREAWILALILVLASVAGCTSDAGSAVEANDVSDGAEVREENVELKEENERLKERVFELQAFLAEKNETIDSLEGQKSALDEMIERKETIIDGLQTQLKEKNKTIDRLQERIRELENETDGESGSDGTSSNSETSCGENGQPEKVEYLKTDTDTGNYDADAADEKRFWIYGQAGDDSQVEFAANVDVLLEKDEGGWDEEEWRTVDEWSLHVCPADFEDYAWNHGFYTLIDDGQLEDGETYRATVTVVMDATGDEFADSNEFSHYEG